VRAEVAAPLTEQASAALAEWQDADTAQQIARERLRTVGRFGKRRATREHHTAQTLARRRAATDEGVG
jgi:hydroxymethylglutaryl-CoA reductase